MKRSKIENQILVMLAFFSISIGLWGNFRQLWLQDNNFSAVQISNIISIGSLVSVIGIIFVAKYIHLNKLKEFITISIILKFINLLLLYSINKSGYILLMNVSISIDIVIEYIIVSSIYPLITTIIKNNTIYSKRKLTEYLFRDIGILIGGIFIGKDILGMLVNYNFCLIISSIFLLISIIWIMNIKVSNNSLDIEKKYSIVKYVSKDKIVVTYLVYAFIGAIGLSTSLGLKMLTLTNYFEFSDNLATNYLLIVGLICDIFGIIALKWLTPKNDYITITIKFGIRLSLYIIAFLSNTMALTMIALTWSVFIGAAYEDVCDGPYINSVENEYQLSFTNFRYIIKFLGESIGVFFCGLMYEKGIRYMFGLSAFFISFQIGIAYYLIYMRGKMKSNSEIRNVERKHVYARAYVTNENNEIINDEIEYHKYYRVKVKV